VNDNDQAAILSLDKGSHSPRWLWSQDDNGGVEDQPVDFSPSLVSLGFIKAALRRSVAFWGAMAVAGLVIGAVLYVASPHPYQASTSLLLNVGPEQVPGTAILDDQTMAESRTVAGLALHKLGVREDVNSFLGSYTTTVLTDRVLLITVNASSGKDAVSRANALAAALLQYRTSQLEDQQKLVFGSLDQQVNQARQRITKINNQIGQQSAQNASPARLSNLRAERSQALTALTVLEQNVNSNKASMATANASEGKGSVVLAAAAPIPPHGRLKHLLLYAAIGLIGGLALGLGIVLVRALVSDRLYQRKDVARALGAPVRLSVGAVRLSRWWPGGRGLAGARTANVQRIVAYLRGEVPERHRGGAAALAIVPVDDPQVAALSLVSLGVSCAHEGMRVVLVDLISGAPAAGLAGIKKPGVHTASVRDAHFVVAVPGPSVVVPVGPRYSTSPQAPDAPSQELVAAYTSADLLLTLVSLDPSLGGEHLPTWADDAVVMITAGRSSWAKINAVGEMVRLAGVRLDSAVLVGADKTDGSLGLTHTPRADREAEVAEDELAR
jgi:hypothetical protein